MSATSLYFAYTALLAPERISAVAPSARFMFSAHFPATRLCFVANGSKAAIPSLTAHPEHTVWGGVFSIPESEVAALVAAERREGREPGWEMKAIDREGNKHDCLTFVASGSDHVAEPPYAGYLDDIIRGARHWKLPAGWIVGLEDLIDEDELLA